MQAIIVAICCLLLIAALLWLLLPKAVIEIPAADSEDRELFSVLVDPDALNDILSEVNHPFVTIRQIDAVIEALAKRGHVIIAPCREDIEQAASLLDGRMLP